MSIQTSIEAAAGARLSLLAATALVAKADLSAGDLASGGLKAPEQAAPNRRVSFRGIPIELDRPAGFVKRGTDKSGQPWERAYKVDYGFVPGVESLGDAVGDGEDLDVYLDGVAGAYDEGADVAYVLLQVHEDGEPDELKVVLGARSRERAREIYVDHAPARLLAGIAEMPVDMLKALLGIGEVEARKALAAVAKSLWSSRLPVGDSAPIAKRRRLERATTTAKAFTAKPTPLVNRPDLNDHPARSAQLTDRYDPPTRGGWIGSIEPDGGSWIAFVGKVGDVLLWESREVDGGVIGSPVSFTRPDLAKAFEREKEIARFADKEVDWAARVVGVGKALDPEQRFVLAIVLEPEVVDAQGDVYSADEIRKAQRIYMKRFQNVGLNHKQLVNGRASLVESWIAPIDFELEGSTIRKGTWMIGIEIEDDDLWRRVKGGELTGCSIGGLASRDPIT